MVAKPPGRDRLDKVEGLTREAVGTLPLLIVVLADMGMGLTTPPGIEVAESLGSGGEWPALMLDETEPVDERVDVNGMAKLALGRWTRETASDSEAGDPVRVWKDSMVDEEAVLGDVTRDRGAELALRSAADDEEAEPGLEEPFKLLSDADASDEVLCRFLEAVTPSALPLLEIASSGMSGIPADRSCG